MMNERIKELARDAGLLVHNPDGVPTKLERFADLIIQECLLTLEPDPMAPAIRYNVEEKFYKRSANKIKQHFYGVE